MQTEVIMKRELFGEQISQKSKSEFFSATDLLAAGNKYRVSQGLSKFNLSQYLKSKAAMEFMEELDKKFNTKTLVVSRGKNSQTWVHPLLFIDIALAISPKLKIEVYEWLFDHLIANRNISGDSYKEMSAAIYSLYTNKKEFHKYIERVANYIKRSVGVSDWEKATSEQLDIRNKIHVAIKLFCNVLKDTDQAVRLGVIEYCKPKQLQS